MSTVLQEVTQVDIPTELSERLAEEKRIETVSDISCTYIVAYVHHI